MKIAVTAQSTDLDAQVDPRFGRAPYIIIVDSVSMTFDVLNNEKNVNALKGAGIQAGVMIKDAGADVLLTGYCGPNAMKTLNAANIKVGLGLKGSIKNAVNAVIDEQVSFLTEPNCEGHNR